MRTFDDGTGVRGVDIRVAPGEIHALVGLNGAGKSTLMRLLLGMLKPDRGTVTIAGRSLRHADMPTGRPSDTWSTTRWRTTN
ncbi:ATP-binding cassette domain-containing protein [Kribbella sp. NPDC026596]|uniref:ATP-binding cassette domain-containing protein n=1 Tax=Kribbella sp. NPDC026596 TaxID=3155122 RepID=UPI0033C5B20F